MPMGLPAIFFSSLSQLLFVPTRRALSRVVWVRSRKPTVQHSYRLSNPHLV